MFEPLPLEEHWTIIAVAEPERDVAVRAVVDAEEDEVAGLVAAGRRIGADAARDTRSAAAVCPGGRRPFAVHCVEVVSPMSMPACANAQRANIEQSQVVPAGSRLCMSCDRSAAVGRRAEVVGEAADVRDGPGEDERGPRLTRRARKRRGTRSPARGRRRRRRRRGCTRRARAGSRPALRSRAEGAPRRRSRRPDPRRSRARLRPRRSRTRRSSRSSAGRSPGTVIGGVPARQVEPRNCIGPVAPASFTVPGGLQPAAWLRPWSHSILPIAARTAQSMPYRAACLLVEGEVVARDVRDGDGRRRTRLRGSTASPTMPPTTMTSRKTSAAAARRTRELRVERPGQPPATEPAVIGRRLYQRFNCNSVHHLYLSITSTRQDAPNSIASAGTRSSAACTSEVPRCRREPHRQEAVRLDAELADVASVCVAGEQHRDRHASRVALAHDVAEQAAGARGLGRGDRGLLGYELERRESARQRLQLGEEVRRRHAREGRVHRDRPRARSG